MFNFFKRDPLKKLEKLYENKITKAMHAQRAGNIQEFARLSNEAEVHYKELEEMKKK